LLLPPPKASRAGRKRAGGGAREPVEPAVRSEGTGDDLGALLEEAWRVARRARRTVRRLYGRLGLSVGEAATLRDLERRGPQTVPQLARGRSLTRQHVRALVNELAERGWVERVENPAHRRSQLVRLTARGRTAARRLAEEEADFLGRLETGLDARALREAAGVLRAVGRALRRRSVEVQAPSSSAAS
jgi:DNA-binding MarR family transcriptional regulator